jgi:hypothetical protein
MGIKEQQPRRYWAFFANPDLYRIEDAILELPEDPWVTKGKPVRAGDRALIWRGAGTKGAARGVIAFGEILSDPTVLDGQSPFWIDPERGGPELRARMRYHPIPRPLLLDGHGGTVFEIEEALCGSASLRPREAGRLR